VYHEIRDRSLRLPESLYRLEQVGSWSDKGGVEFESARQTESGVRRVSIRGKAL
jgi:hypothetical protein